VPIDVLLADGSSRPVRVAAGSADPPSAADALLAAIGDAPHDSPEPEEKPATLRREQPDDIGKPGKKDDGEGGGGGA
jgi:hypothetical protein